MKKFINKSLFLCTPLFVFFFLVLIIDPFNYLNNNGFVNERYKHKISKKVEPHMFKMIDYRNNPKKNIILGDSRSSNLYENICKYSDSWKDLSYGGGSLKEVIQSFYWAVNKNDLDTVIIGISFNLYNDYNKRFWVEETSSRIESVVSYAFSSYSLRASVLILKSIFYKKESSIGIPNMSKTDFWDSQLMNFEKKYFKKYMYPNNYFERLKEISFFCKNNNIKLILWIPPTHTSMQNLIVKNNLIGEYNKFILDLTQIGETYNFNIPNQKNSNKANFDDPAHFNFSMGEIIYNDILKSKTNSKYLINN